MIHIIGEEVDEMHKGDDSQCSSDSLGEFAKWQTNRWIMDKIKNQQNLTMKLFGFRFSEIKDIASFFLPIVLWENEWMIKYPASSPCYPCYLHWIHLSSCLSTDSIHHFHREPPLLSWEWSKEKTLEMDYWNCWCVHWYCCHHDHSYHDLVHSSHS